MWDFDGDEVLFLVAAAGATLILTLRLLLHLYRVDALVARRTSPDFIVATLLACLGIIYVVLANWSDALTVRGHADYMTLFMFGGAAWTLVAAFIRPLSSVSVRDDAVERGNPAATIVICGVMLANAICYAGANIGQGPTIWTTIWPALGASGALALSLGIVRETTKAWELIAIERDIRAAWSFAAFSVANGIIFGWAMAGDWESWRGTVVDFVQRCWPAGIVTLIAIGALRKRRQQILLESAR